MVRDTSLLDASAFAREIHLPAEETARLQRGVELAVELIAGCDHAGVSVFTKSGAATDAATSDLVWRGDDLQYSLDEGPCLDVMAGAKDPIVSNDIATDERWPRLGPAVSHVGVGSVLSLRLYTDSLSIGSLNLYAEGAWSYGHRDIEIASALATHLALAAASSRELAHRGTAMTTRTVIGQAQGILIERYRLTPDRAFDVLRRISENSNRKLSAVATGLVSSGTLPELRSMFGARSADFRD